MAIREPRLPNWDQERADIEERKKELMAEPKLPDWKEEKTQSRLAPVRDEKEFLNEIERDKKRPESLNDQVQLEMESFYTPEAQKKAAVVYDARKNRAAEAMMTSEMRMKTEKREQELTEILLKQREPRDQTEAEAAQTRIIEMSKVIPSVPPFRERIWRDIKDTLWLYLTPAGWRWRGVGKKK